MKYHNFEQGTPEWFEMRKLKMTASHAQAIGNKGKGLETYVYELLADFYSQVQKEHYSNKDTERGVELEPLAREVYELENNVIVNQVGFIELEDEYTGCSPDGLINDDGGLEIKCVNDVSHYKMIVNGEKEIDTKYIWQVQMNLLVTERKWWDLCFYNPNFRKSLIKYRIQRDEEKIIAIREGLQKGKELIINQQKIYADKA